MTKVKQNKIQKLKTKHIWPTLIGFVISVVLLGALVMSTMSMALLYTLETEYSNKSAAVQYIADSVQKDYENKVPFDAALAKVDRDNICIIDKDNHVVASKSETDINFYGELELKVGFSEMSAFFTDEGNKLDWLDDDGGISPEPFSLMKKAFAGHPEGSEQRNNGWFADVLYRINCWIVPAADLDEYRLLVKSELQIHRKDLLYVCINALATIALVMIPLVIMLINVISAVRVQKRMRNLIYLDETTGGRNWAYFKENGTKVLTRRWNRNKTYAIVDFELMKYRNLCMYSGVAEGERVLEKINDTICTNIARRDICTRYGKANYALLIRCENEQDAKVRLEKIMGLLANVAGCHRSVFHAGCYMVTPFMGADDKNARLSIDIADIYNRASAARASISDAEDNAIAIFTEKLLEDQLWEHKVEDEMQAAIDNHEFVVYYQPKYNPVTEELAGAEALIRWKKADGLVPPGKFIPIFEKNGFITKIDDYMIENVARQQAEWLKEGRKIVPVSVNVSRAHFTQEDLAEHILELVDRYETPHEYIEIELTESAFFDDKNALLGTVKKLKEYGFEISMDDFGAGYSSLNSLKDLPLDVLKLDADFFRGEDNNKRAEIVVTEAITLAKQLNMRIVAEGIEKKNQVEFLAGVGCDMIQGYYFAKPMPAKEYEERMSI